MIHLHKVSKVYGSGESAVRALDAVDVEIADFEFVAITGPSGSGKSTMLHLLGALDTPTTASSLSDLGARRDLKNFSGSVSA